MWVLNANINSALLSAVGSRHHEQSVDDDVMKSVIPILSASIVGRSRRWCCIFNIHSDSSSSAPSHSLQPIELHWLDTRAAQTSFARHELNVGLRLQWQLRRRSIFIEPIAYVLITSINIPASRSRRFMPLVGWSAHAISVDGLSRFRVRIQITIHFVVIYLPSLSIFNGNWWFITFSAPSLSLSYSLSLSSRPNRIEHTGACALQLFCHKSFNSEDVPVCTRSAPPTAAATIIYYLAVDYDYCSVFVCFALRWWWVARRRYTNKALWSHLKTTLNQNYSTQSACHRSLIVPLHVYFQWHQPRWIRRVLRVCVFVWVTFVHNSFTCEWASETVGPASVNRSKEKSMAIITNIKNRKQRIC